MNRSVVSATLFLIFCLGIGGCSDARTTQEYIGFAQAFRQAGDLDSAVVELKNALRQSPDSVEARWMLGSIYLDSGDGEGAEKELRRCADLGMEYNEIVVPLMQALSAQEKYQETIDTLFDEPAMDDEALKEIWLLRGHAYLKLRELGAAQESFEKALALEDGNPEALLGKARVAAHRDSFAKARSWLDKVFESDPAYPPAWSFLGDIEQFQQNPEAAEAAYTKALETRPNDVYDLASRAMMRIFQNKLRSAEQDFQAARRENARLKVKQPLVLYVRGQLNLRRDKNDIAAAAFDSMLEQAPNYLPARFFLAVAHYKQGNIEQAEENLGIFRAKAPRYAAGHRLYAALKFSQGNYKEAREVLENLLAFDADDPWSLALLADVAVLEGDPGKSVENYRRIVELHPESESAHLKLALGLMMEDQEAARAALREAARRGNAGQADLLTIVSHMNSGDWDAAIAIAKDVINENPKNWDAYTLLGGAYAGSGNQAQARAMYEKALELKPGNPNAGNNLARLKLQEGDVDGARRLYQSILRNHPKESSTLLALSTLDQQTGALDAATGRLEKAIEEDPDNLALRLGLARLYLRTGQPSRNLSLVYEAEGDQATDPRILEILGRSQMALGQYPLALNNFQKLMAQQSSNPESHYLLALAQLQTNQLEAGMKSLETVTDLKPDHFGASVMRVRVLRQQNRLDEAAKLFQKIDQVHAERPEVLVEEGWLALHEKDYALATTAFTRAFELVPSSLLAIQLGIARWNSGERAAAIDGYKGWLKDNPDDLQVMFHLANSHMQQGQSKAAIKVYERMLETKPDDILVMNNIAWLLRKDNPAKAMQWIEKTLAISPDWAPGLDTLGMLQLDKGELNKAHRTFEKASKAAPGDPEIRYHLALATAKIGEEKQAAQILKAVLASPVDFPARADAKALLSELGAR